jgi:hypothetical protein
MTNKKRSQKNNNLNKLEKKTTKQEENDAFKKCIIENYINYKEREYYYDIKKLNKLVERYNPSSGLFYNYKMDVDLINALLKKYENKRFYLTYEAYDGTTIFESKSHQTKNWKIYTEEMVPHIVPKYININDVCYFCGGKPFFNVKYPMNYVNGTIVGLFNPKREYHYIEHLAFIHKNLYFVHPEILENAVNSM